MARPRPPSVLSSAADVAIGWATDHPKTILIIAAAITALAVAFIPLLRVDVDFANYLNRKDPAVIAADEAKERFGSQLRVIVAIEDPKGVFRAETLALAEALEAALEDLPEVEDMVGPLSSQVIRGTETSIQIRSAAPRGVAPQTSVEIATYRDLVLSDNTLGNYVVSSTETALAIYLKPVPEVDMVPFAAAVEDVVLAHETEGISFSISGLPYINLTLQRSMKRDLQLFLPLVIGSTPMAFVGGAFLITASAYKIILGVCLLLAFWRLLWEQRDEGVTDTPSAWLTVPIGAALGFIAGMTGVGGGIFLSPLLLFLHWTNMRGSAAIAAAFILVNSVAGLAGHASVTQAWPAGIPLLVAVAVCGGLLGSELGARRIAPAQLRKILGMVLAVAGLKMIATA